MSDDTHDTPNDSTTNIQQVQADIDGVCEAIRQLVGEPGSVMAVLTRGDAAVQAIGDATERAGLGLHISQAKFVAGALELAVEALHSVRRVLHFQDAGPTLDVADSTACPVRRVRDALLLRSQLRGYMRRDDDAYEPLYTSRGDMGGVQRVGSIRDVMSAMLANIPEIQAVRFSNEAAVKAISSIVTQPDPRLPTVECAVGVYMGENLVLDARDPRRIRLSSDPLASQTRHDPCKGTCRMCPTRYVPGWRFDPAWLDCDYFDIPTPIFSSFFDFQHIPQEDQRLVLMVIGRLLYPVNQFDAWQIVPFIKGVANNGKSTLIKIIEKFFAKSDVATISSNTQTQFALAQAFDKRLWSVTEVTNDFAMAEADFLAIVAGDTTEIRGKYEKARSVEWRVPGIMAGNQLPTCYKNTSGNVLRRIFMIPFNQDIPRGCEKNDIDSKVVVELPAILVKCARAYGEGLARFDGANPIRKNLTPWLAAAHAELDTQLSPLVYFLEASGLVVLAPGASVPESKFLDAFNQMCHQHNTRPPQWNADLYFDVFRKRSVHVTMCETSFTYGLETLPRGTRILVGVDLSA